MPIPLAMQNDLSSQSHSSSCPHPSVNNDSPPSPSSSSTNSHSHPPLQESHSHHVKPTPGSSPRTNSWRLSLKSCSQSPRSPVNLPSALDHISEFITQLASRKCRIVFFLDYDGTLSPIVDDPDSATIPPTVRTALSAVSSRFTTAIVTGRSKKKVMEMVQLDHLIYAASHGFDIHSPDGRVRHRVAHEFIPVMRKVAEDLGALCDRFPGTHVEDNFLSITLHFRQLQPSLKVELVSQVNEIAARYGVCRHDGKMVHELRPPHDWHKGKAVDYLLSTLKLTGPDVVPIYIGDDIADESAFLAVRERGFSVIVAEESLTRTTCADLRLRDPFEVGKFLMHFAGHEGLAV